MSDRMQWINPRLRVLGALLRIQSVAFGCAGAVTLILVLVSVASGWQYLLFAAATFAVAILLAGVAAGVWILAGTLRSGLNRWTLGTLALQLVLSPMGSLLFNLGTQARPDENPFQEGGDGLTALLGIVMAGSGAIALVVLVFELVISIARRRGRPAGVV